MQINTSNISTQFSRLVLKNVILVQVVIYSLLILFRFFYESFDSEADSLIYHFCLILCGLTIWSFWSWYIVTKSLFNPYILFLLSVFLFNGGQTLLEIFHINEYGVLKYLNSPSDIPPLSALDILNTIFLVVISMGGMHLGALISLVTIKDNYQFSKTYTCNIDAQTKNSYIIGWRLFCLSVLPAIYVLKGTISLVASGGYSSIYEQDSATSFSAAPNVIAAFLVPASLFILAGSSSQKNGKGRLIGAGVIIFYAMTRFFTGERNQAIMPLISLAWLWHRLVKPIPKTFLFGISSLMIFVIFPVVAATRNTAGQDRLSIDSLIEVYSSIDNPIIASLSEMGGSMITVAYTLLIFPRDKDFQLGADYFYAILTIIPNIFGKLHPTVARGLPNNWLTEQINPYIASIHGSYGFSLIAEAYQNFGWVGAPIALGVIGFLFAKFMLWADQSCDPAKIAMVASFLSFFLFYARAESALMVRPLIWYSIIPYLCVRALNTSSKKLVR